MIGIYYWGKYEAKQEENQDKPAKNSVQNLEKEQQHSNEKAFIISVLILVFGVMLYFLVENKPDIGSYIGSIVSAIALVWLVFGYRQQNKAIILQATELNKSVKAQEELAQNSINVLKEQKRIRAEQLEAERRTYPKYYELVIKGYGSPLAFPTESDSLITPNDANSLISKNGFSALPIKEAIPDDIKLVYLTFYTENISAQSEVQGITLRNLENRQRTVFKRNQIDNRHDNYVTFEGEINLTLLNDREPEMTIEDLFEQIFIGNQLTIRAFNQNMGLKHFNYSMQRGDFENCRDEAHYHFRLDQFGLDTF